MHAFEFNASQWDELKSNYVTLGLRMPCCDTSAIPKTSARGNFFFAHARKGDCATAPESAEHLYCKSVIALAARSEGWTVTTEKAGVSPSGEEWIADILCEKGKAKVALEVQMSSQTVAETQRRQQRYSASGVRAAWFLGPKARDVAATSTRELPAFSLGAVEVGTVPVVEGFQFDLSAFVAGMLNRKLRWTTPMVSRPLYIEYIEDICWKCRQPIRQVYGLLDSPEESDRWGFHDRAFTVATVSSGIAEVLRAVDSRELVQAGLNPLMERKVVKGKPTVWGFSNQCLHCQVPQDNFYLAQKLSKASLRLRPDLGGSDFEFDEDSEPEQTASGRIQIERTIQAPGRWEWCDTVEETTTSKSAGSSM